MKLIKTSLVFTFLFISTLMVAPVAALATTLNYTISGTGSGSLDGNAFSNAEFTFSLTGDSENLSSNILNPLDSATFSIAGVGSGTFHLATRIGAIGSVVFFSRGSGLDLFDFFTDATADLSSAFTVSGTGGAFALNQFNDVATSAGALGFDSASGITFSSEALPPVPLPATAWMLFAGLGGLAAFKRRKTA